MRQIVYVSLSTIEGDKADLAGILQQSRHNNAIDGITGLLWSDGHRFLQAFEGPPASVAATFGRIVDDRRHHSITVLEDRIIERPEFGGWTMMHRRATDAPDAYHAQMTRALSKASLSIRAQFIELLTADAANAHRQAVIVQR
ncbi:BLUF domain-containing protein [Sphingomonas sp. PB4P5]|uniref:BLUF domain-containing protein n=1 Tax=Parasphingomonas puruogangriensis TaxID=3096155 RepID=UPI002FCA963C